MFGVTGGVTRLAVRLIGSYGNNPVTNGADQVTSDIQIETANAWLRNGFAREGKDFVNNYKTDPGTMKVIGSVGRAITIIDLYRGGARTIRDQQKK